MKQRRQSAQEWQEMREREQRQAQRRQPRRHIYAGLDVSSGKRHPSHLAILKGREIETEDGQDHMVFKQVVSHWFDDVPLSKVVEQTTEIADEYGVEGLRFDNSRDELTVSIERSEIPQNWQPVKITQERKYQLAHRLIYALSEGELKLLPDERQKRQLALVDEALKADETAEGHAEPFTSLGLALEAAHEFSKSLEERFQLFL